MTIRIGLLGAGFMGKCHFETYERIAGARVVALCDLDGRRRHGDWSGLTGNLGGAGRARKLPGVRSTDDMQDLFRDPGVDVVDICLPTHLHAAAAMAALRAGKHVICEKPMARTSAQGRRMIAAARAAGRQLFVAQCIRFWPAYAKARDLVRSGRYGRVLSASFRRLSPTPRWSWNNWLLDGRLSGGAALDLHIHDADFVLHCLGMPRSVTSFGTGRAGRGLDHIVTHYDYADKALITAEGGWGFAPDYPFSMSFTIVLEKATLRCGPDLALSLHLAKGGTQAVAVPPGDGYEHELRHFLACIRTGKASPVVTPESALDSVRLVEAEIKSARAGKAVRP